METNSLSSETVKKCLNDLLNAMFPKQNHTYIVDQATKKGDNYLGVVYRIIPTPQEVSKEQFSLILKVPPDNLIRRKQFFARPCFIREALAYEEFLPLVMHFQISKGVEYSEGFYAVAKCYHTLTTEMNEAIFLEDLHLRGYKMFDRFDAINVDFVSIVMRIYGQLHAVSFAIKDQCAEKLRKFQKMEDIFEQRRQDNQLRAYFEELKTSTLNTLNSEVDKIYKLKLKSFFAKGTFFDIFLELLNGAQCEPYAVVCHGDCWNNNILFKYEESIKKSKVVDACLIDWQIMRYASPVSDLVYYLFTCTTKNFREDYYQDMLNVYYNALSDHMKRLGSDPVQQFSRDVFDKELKKFGAIGLLMAMIVLPIITMKGDDVPDLEALSERIEAGGTTDLRGAGLLGQTNLNAYSERMRDVVVDIIENGYI